MNRLPIVQLWNHYAKYELFKAFVTGFVFYLLLAAIVITPTIVISFLYVPFMMYFMLGMYVALSMITSYAVHIFIETLQNYKTLETVLYETFAVRSTVTIAFLTFVILAFVYIQYIE